MARHQEQALNTLRSLEQKLHQDLCKVGKEHNFCMGYWSIKCSKKAVDEVWAALVQGLSDAQEGALLKTGKCDRITVMSPDSKTREFTIIISSVSTDRADAELLLKTLVEQYKVVPFSFLTDMAILLNLGQERLHPTTYEPHDFMTEEELEKATRSDSSKDPSKPIIRPTSSKPPATPSKKKSSSPPSTKKPGEPSASKASTSAASAESKPSKPSSEPKRSSASAATILPTEQDYPEVFKSLIAGEGPSELPMQLEPGRADVLISEMAQWLQGVKIEVEEEGSSTTRGSKKQGFSNGSVSVLVDVKVKNLGLKR